MTTSRKSPSRRLDPRLFVFSAADATELMSRAQRELDCGAVEQAMVSSHLAQTHALLWMGQQAAEMTEELRRWYR